MDWNRVEGNWKQLKGSVRERWGKLTDDDFDRIAGKKDILVGRLQELYGQKKDEVEADLKDWHDETYREDRADRAQDPRRDRPAES